MFSSYSVRLHFFHVPCTYSNSFFHTSLTSCNYMSQTPGFSYRVFWFPTMAFTFFMQFILFTGVLATHSRRRNRCKRLGGPSGRGLAFASTLSTWAEQNRFVDSRCPGVRDGPLHLPEKRPSLTEKGTYMWSPSRSVREAAK